MNTTEHNQKAPDPIAPMVLQNTHLHRLHWPQNSESNRIKNDKKFKNTLNIRFTSKKWPRFSPMLVESPIFPSIYYWKKNCSNPSSTDTQSEVSKQY